MFLLLFLFVIYRAVYKILAQHESQEEYFQSTITSLMYNNKKTTVGAVYCPSRHKISKEMFVDVFVRIGNQFILAGGFNAKHTAWGSRLITPKGS